MDFAIVVVVVVVVVVDDDDDVVNMFSGLYSLICLVKPFQLIHSISCFFTLTCAF